MNPIRRECRFPGETSRRGGAAAVLPVLLLLVAVAPASLRAADPPGATLKEVTVSKTPYATSIEAVIEGKFENYNSFKLNDPFRIVVDVWGVSQGGAAPEIAANTPQVKSVKLSQQENKLRFIVETPEDRPLPFLVNVDGGRLVVSVGGGAEEKVTSLDRKEEGAVAPRGPAIVGLDLEDLPERSSVVVTTAGDVTHQVVRKEGTVTLVFPGASADKGLNRRPIDARALGIPVKFVTPSAVKNGFRVAVAHDAGANYAVEKKENAVVVSFPKKGNGAARTVARLAGETGGPPAGLPGQEKAAAPGGGEPEGGDVRGGPPQKWGFITSESTVERKYIGQRISLDFKDADIVNILRIIAEVSHLNIIAADDVKGKVSLRLVNVPWDQALDIMLRSRGLGVSQEGNVLRIATLTSLRSEEKARLDTRKEVEKLKASLEAVVETIPVSYGKVGDMKTKVKDLLSEGGKIEVDERTHTLIIRDLRKNIDDVKALIARLDTSTPQVLIEARIVEVDTNFARDLGVQWGFSGQRTRGLSTYGAGGIMDSTGALAFAQPVDPLPVSPTFAVNLPAAVGTGAGGGISVGFLRGNNLRLDLSLSALEASGKGKVISSPKVVTLDNKEATIEQGSQIPYSQTSASGTNTQFIDATLSLKVTPRITPDGRVEMRVEAKNDSPGAVGATGQPAINKKKATTEVLVRDGDTAVIGGILQISRKEDEAGVPWLSKIPVLGFFFRNQKTTATNRELLIFITPKILGPETQQAKTF